MESPERDKLAEYRRGLWMVGVVTSYPLLVVGGAQLGILLDRRAGTEPWLMTAGFLLGAGACVLETWAALKLWKRT